MLVRVGMDGIKADLLKLTVVINWWTPTTIQNLGSFFGLTGYFWPLMKNYSLLEKPLKDLLNTLEVSKASRKCVYQAAAQAHKLKNQWSWEHNKVFVILKTALTGFLVLKGPKYDGSSLSSPQMDAKMGLWISSPNASSGSAPNRNPKLMSTPSQLH